MLGKARGSGKTYCKAGSARRARAGFRTRLPSHTQSQRASRGRVRSEGARARSLTSVVLDCAANAFPDERSRGQFEGPHPYDPEPPDPFPLYGREVLEQVFAESEFGREEARADDGRHGEGDEVKRDEAAAGAQGAAEGFGPGRGAHVELRVGLAELLSGSCEAGGGACAEEGSDVADRLGEQRSRSRSFRGHACRLTRLETGCMSVVEETTRGEHE